MKQDLREWIRTSATLEHWPMYLALHPWARDQRVLDVGEGDGAALALLLDANARAVVSMTRDPARLDELRRQFDNPALTWVVGSLKLLTTPVTAEINLADQMDDQVTLPWGPSGELATSLDALPAGLAAAVAPLDEPFDLIILSSSRQLLALTDPGLFNALLQRLTPGGTLALLWSHEMDGSEAYQALLGRFEEHFAHHDLLRRRLALSIEWRISDDVTPEHIHHVELDAETDGARPENVWHLFRHEPVPDRFASALSLEGEALTSQLIERPRRMRKSIAELDHQVLMLEEQIAQKDQLIDDLEAEARRSETGRRQLERQRDRLGQELDALQAELTTVPASADVDAQRGLLERDQSIMALTEQLQDTQRDNRQLREALDRQRSTLDAWLGQAKPALRALDTAGATPGTTRTAGLSQTRPLLLDHASLLREAMAELARAERALHASQRHRANQQRRVVQLEESHARLVAESRSKSDLLIARRRELDAAQALFDAFQRDTEQALATYEARLDVMARSLAFAGQSVDLEHQRALDELQAHIANHERTLDKVRDTLAVTQAELDDAHDGLVQARRQRDDARDYADQLIDALEAAQAQVDIHEQTIADLKTSRETLDAKLQACQDELERVRAEHAQRTHALATLQKEHATLQRALTAASSSSHATAEAVVVLPSSASVLQGPTTIPGIVDPVAQDAALDERLRLARQEIRLREVRINTLESQLLTLRDRIRRRDG